MMESLTPKEFLEKLKINNLKPAFVLKGLVKASEKDTEVLFALKQDILHWATLPVSMIESVVVLKSLPNKYEPSAFVKLHLKSPSDPEAKALYDLLMASETEGGHEHTCGMKKEMGQGFSPQPQLAGELTKGRYCPCCGHDCSCGCMNKHPEHTGGLKQGSGCH